ncbi:MAG: TIGR03842 family LLM class F420-dependent oxidoreductase [Anaerolineaceae bacterium]|nr:TIGR03842 family LLM class F420-dependent oxidoreductase [Anaerolineaceae bacterium]
MDFGITFKGDISAQRTVALCQQAEAAGFRHAWFFDSHVLWRECYVTMAMCMEHTERMIFGPLVTNPGVREWSVAASLYATLLHQSEGRFELGLGRGDSSRRVLGKKPNTLARMVDFTQTVKSLVRGDPAGYDDTQTQLPWPEGYDLPIWVAAYGPKALQTAGEIGDGLVIQLGEPLLVKWFSEQALRAGQQAGRDMSQFGIMAAAPVWVGEMEKAREQTRWFPAMVGNHVADIVQKYGSTSAEVPQSLTDYIEGRRGYDYAEHADKDAEHLDFITDDITDSFSLLGDVDAQIAKLQQLKDVGVTQFNIYLMCGEEERMVDAYGSHIIPHFT